MARAANLWKLHNAGLGLVLASAVLLLLAVGSAFADQEKGGQEGKSEQTGQQPGHDEMMAVYMEAAKPGPEHQMLAKSAGTWKATISPGWTPARSRRSPRAPRRPRWSSGALSADPLRGLQHGHAVRGHRPARYDNLKKLYVGTWCDNMGTGIMSYEGSYDPSKKEMVCHVSSSTPPRPDGEGQDDLPLRERQPACLRDVVARTHRRAGQVDGDYLRAVMRFAARSLDGMVLESD